MPLAIAIFQLVFSCAARILFGIAPSGRMFGDRVGSKSSKYLASQTFTASYSELEHNARIASVFLCILNFGCKFVKSYSSSHCRFKSQLGHGRNESSAMRGSVLWEPIVLKPAGVHVNNHVHRTVIHALAGAESQQTIGQRMPASTEPQTAKQSCRTVIALP